MTTHLPIERKPEILQEYGRAFACINLVESGINTVLSHKGKFSQADPELTLILFDQMMLGQKIGLAQKFLSKKLVSDLWKLNEKRVLLAHGITMVGDNDSIAIAHKQNFTDLSKEFLSGTVNFAKALYERIMQEIRPGKK